jgi:hypothetical protein
VDGELFVCQKLSIPNNLKQKPFDAYFFTPKKEHQKSMKKNATVVHDLSHSQANVSKAPMPHFVPLCCHAGAQASTQLRTFHGIRHAHDVVCGDNKLSAVSACSKPNVLLIRHATKTSPPPEAAAI